MIHSPEHIEKLRLAAAANSIWTESLSRQLETLWNEGLSTAKIGKRLNLSKGAVAGRAFRMDLQKRPSPIRPAKESVRLIGRRPNENTLPPLISDGCDMSGIPWSADDLATLHRMNDTHTRAEIGIALGRTKEAVTLKASAQGLVSKQKGFHTLEFTDVEVEIIKEMLAAGRSNTAITDRLKCGLSRLLRFTGTLPRLRQAPLPLPEPAPKPLPVALVPIVTRWLHQPIAPARTCQWPLWAEGEKPKFKPDWTPLMCDAPSVRGSYCACHAAVAFTRVAKMELECAA